MVRQAHGVLGEVGADVALDEVPGHESDAVDEAERCVAMRGLEVHGVDHGCALEPGESLFDDVLAAVGGDHLLVVDGPAFIAGADEDVGGLCAQGLLDALGVGFNDPVGDAPVAVTGGLRDLDRLLAWPSTGRAIGADVLGNVSDDDVDGVEFGRGDAPRRVSAGIGFAGVGKGGPLGDFARGAIPPELAAILSRLDLKVDQWLASMLGWREMSVGVIGGLAARTAEAARRGTQWVRNHCSLFAGERKKPAGAAA